MSSKSDSLVTLSTFGKVRRQLNLIATGALRPLGLGPKQAVLLRELRALKAASLSDLARLTHTDLASTGKIIESLATKRWVARSADPNDRRRCLVSLTRAGQAATQKLESVYHSLSQELCASLTESEQKSFSQILNKVFSHLERTLDTPQE